MGTTIDQILLWDTAPDGTVSLSPDPSALTSKIRATRLIGGHIVVRAAELFEGEDFFYQSAVSPNGYLYQLMKSGWASVDLRGEDSWEKRVEWKFRNPDRVIDRGQTITDGRHRRAIRNRVEQRVVGLKNAEWGIAPKQVEISKSLFTKNLNRDFRRDLKVLGEHFIGPERLPDTAMGEFIHGTEQVEGRGDLYEPIERRWAQYARDDQRREFEYECKRALTVTSALHTTRRYGHRTSELRPDSFGPLSYGALVSQGRVKAPELQILRALYRLLWPYASEHGEAETTPLDAARFADLAADMVTTQDRENLYRLLYHKSSVLDGDNLVEKCASVDDADIVKQWVELRWEEFVSNEEVVERRWAQALAFVLSAEVGFALLVLLPSSRCYPPWADLAGTLVSGIAGFVAEELYQRMTDSGDPEDCLLGGYRSVLPGI